MHANVVNLLTKRAIALPGLVVVGLLLAAGCVITSGEDDDDDSSGSQGGSEASGGSESTAGSESTGGEPSDGGSESVAGAEATGGAGPTAGSAGAEQTTGGSESVAGAGGEEQVAGAAGEAGGKPIAGAGGAAGCGAGYVREQGPLQRTCAAETENECDGTADVNSELPNGEFGNGYDDDCDGLADEGCTCPTGTFAGSSDQNCWLVPSSLADTDGEPVGWCEEHARGSRVCVPGPGGAPIWSGECRGAQMPREVDVCSAGDYDCDGLERNAEVDCDCVDVAVECPLDAVETAPYPDPNDLLEIDGSSWVVNGVASNWQWTVTGGDCDNILPHPSFAVYATADANGADDTDPADDPGPIGEEQTGLGATGEQKGFVIADGPATIYPAFALSGDYLVKAEFEVDGTPQECTVKVQVRAPGIRAEACWSPMPNDLDLHFARLQGSGTDPRGWFQTADDDCYYSTCQSSDVGWGYTASDDSVCHGWGSRRASGAGCDNPRLDRDNISCSPDETDPTNTDRFCGAENTNLDNPADGDRFAIALQAYSLSSGNASAHINVYCNGERRLAMGYDPVTSQEFPILMQSGNDDGGDFWAAAVVEAMVSGGEMTDCEVMPIHSASPNARDGSLDYCVDRDPQGGASTGSSEWWFTSSSSLPTLPATLSVDSVSDALCWH